MIAQIDQARTELVLISAYLVPTPELADAIRRAEARGVRVRILTNSLRSNNHTSAHSAYRGFVRSLPGHGVELHEVRALASVRGRPVLQYVVSSLPVSSGASVSSCAWKRSLRRTKKTCAASHLGSFEISAIALWVWPKTR